MHAHPAVEPDSDAFQDQEHCAQLCELGGDGAGAVHELRQKCRKQQNGFGVANSDQKFLTRQPRKPCRLRGSIASVSLRRRSPQLKRKVKQIGSFRPAESDASGSRSLQPFRPHAANIDCGRQHLHHVHLGKNRQHRWIARCCRVVIHLKFQAP
jgi:hypothetical protein